MARNHVVSAQALRVRLHSRGEKAGPNQRGIWDGGICRGDPRRTSNRPAETF